MAGLRNWGYPKTDLEVTSKNLIFDKNYKIALKTIDEPELFKVNDILILEVLTLYRNKG